ncbi:SRPBCC family protein [Nocardioides yefusunii]|uniref:SRPBCC family protein n=1 Tax=Nocardioides yefusunii TaxID=2500546 RepID=A0ABW1R2B0_9ACTN|nr:SRPBCC family protein [Nocardioides yefusunii]
MGKTTRHLVLATIEQSVDVAAPPSSVWPLVSDLKRLAEWSPQVMRSFVTGGGEIGQGTRLLNLNRRGLLVWPTHSQVVRFDPEREIAWRIKENGATWSFSLEAHGAGTRLVQHRELPDGLSELSISLTDRFLGGQPTFQAELQQGMRDTLAWIKSVAEQG